MCPVAAVVALFPSLFSLKDKILRVLKGTDYPPELRGVEAGGGDTLRGGSMALK